MPAPSLFAAPSRQAATVIWPQTAADQEGLRLVLTPMQLSAILQGGYLSAHEIFMNRVWGSAKILGGALEMVGGGALLLVPEPKAVTKVGGGVLVAHELGANDRQAERTGIILDIAVPMVVADVVGAARIASIEPGVSPWPNTRRWADIPSSSMSGARKLN